MDTSYEAGIEEQLQKIDAISGITEDNKKLIRRYAAKIDALDKKLNTRTKHLLYMRKVLELQPNFNFSKKTTREDVEGLIQAFKRQRFKRGADDEPKPPSEAVIYDFKKILKFFFKTMFSDGVEYPKCVKWMKAVRLQPKVTESDILNESEVLHMIETATSSRDKALIALGYDSGIRIGELVNMKKKDINLTTDPAHINVPKEGKTGMRPVPIFFSVPYLAAYLNDMKALEPEDYIWRALAQSHVKGAVSEFGVNKMLKEMAAAAGIKKRIYWHLFRHSRATYYANRMTEAQMRQFFGWSKQSATPSIYTHLVGRDIDDAAKRANGIKVRDDFEKPLLAAKECPKCRMQNGKDASFCTRCGSVMDIQVALQLERLQKNAAKSAVNPKWLEQLVNDAVEARLKKTK